MRFRLACLVAACVLPVVMAAGFLVLHAYQYKRSLIEQHMLETARALTLTVDRDLASIQSAQQVLATSPHLVSGDLAGFHAQAREVLRGFPGADIILAEANGQQMVNTYRRFGEVLPKRNAPALVQRIFETGKPVISDLFLGAVTKRPLIGVDVPVFADGRVVYDLSMTLPADRLGAILAQQRLPSQWTGSILDSNRVIVARTSEPEKFVGRQAGPALRQQMAESKEGTAEVHNIAGT
ncbi:MAG: cache domain-containing protein, partial [Rhodospirillales bacterium]|nr:cache domain-containing protein [Rhodospirillales bacterium]